MIDVPHHANEWLSPIRSANRSFHNVLLSEFRVSHFLHFVCGCMFTESALKFLPSIRREPKAQEEDRLASTFPMGQ